MDLNGKPVVKQTWDARGHGRHKTRFMLPAMQNGVYILHWKAGNYKVTKQVVVEQ